VTMVNVIGKPLEYVGWGWIYLATCIEYIPNSVGWIELWEDCNCVKVVYENEIN